MSLDEITKDSRDIKRHLQVVKEDSGTYIIAVAYSEHFDDNHMLEIPASYGRPLVVTSYNRVRETFHEIALDYHEVGLIPVNYNLIINGGQLAVTVEIP